MEEQIIKQQIFDVWNLFPGTTQLRFTQNLTSVNIASYNPYQDRISIHLNLLVRNHRKFLNKKLSLISYAEFILLHELGHSQDPLLHTTHQASISYWHKYKDLSLPLNERESFLLSYQACVWSMECRAWRWAYKHLPNHANKEEFFVAMRFGLDSYRKDFYRPSLQSA